METKFHFLIQRFPQKPKIEQTHKVSYLVSVDYEKFQPGKITVLHSDKKTIFGVYNTVVEARSALIIDPSYQIWKYLNKEFLINSKELNIKVYLAKNVNIEKTKFKIINLKDINKNLWLTNSHQFLIDSTIYL